MTERVQKPEYVHIIGSLMTTHGESQNDLAAAIGVNRDKINNWFRCKAKLDSENLMKIADHYGVPTDYLLGLKKDPRNIPAAMDELHLSQSAVDAIKTVSQTGYESILGIFDRLISKPAFWTMLIDIAQIKEYVGKPMVKNVHTETAALEAQTIFREKAVSNIPCHLMYGDDFVRFRQYEVDQVIHELLQEELRIRRRGDDGTEK